LDEKDSKQCRFSGRFEWKVTNYDEIIAPRFNCDVKRYYIPTNIEDIVAIKELGVENSIRELDLKDYDDDVNNITGFPNIESIIFSDVTISDINGAIIKSNNLKYISVDKTKDKFIFKPNSLNGLFQCVGLISIDLSYCDLSQLNFSGIQSLTNLKSLNLKNTSITEIPNIPESVEFLYVSNNNIEEIDFKKISFLKILEIFGCYIKRIINPQVNICLTDLRIGGFSDFKVMKDVNCIMYFKSLSKLIIGDDYGLTKNIPCDYSQFYCLDYLRIQDFSLHQKFHKKSCNNSTNINDNDNNDNNDDDNCTKLILPRNAIVKYVDRSLWPIELRVKYQMDDEKFASISNQINDHNEQIINERINSRKGCIALFSILARL